MTKEKLNIDTSEKTTQGVKVNFGNKPKLRTLEEIKMSELGRNNLKAEAVKWVREYNKVAQRHDIDTSHGLVSNQFWIGKAIALMDFFDLTEENLR